jgi:hypothetical protein
MLSPGTEPSSATRHDSENVTAGRVNTLLLLVAVLLPCIAAFAILYRQSLSFPYQDDYVVILEFATNYDQAPTWQSKLMHVATDQVNEYKLGFEHAVVVTDLELAHHLDFGILTGIGNAFLLAIAYLLWRTYQEGEKNLHQRLLLFLPISLIFFSLTYWENLNWATTDLQNIPVIFFSFLAIYLLFPGKTFVPTHMRMLLACLSAALAAFTSANGFLLGPVGLLILLPRRAWVKALVWCASFVVPLAAYLYHFSVPVHPVNSTFYFTRPLFFLAFLGCGAIPLRWPAALAGIVILAILWLAVRTRFDRINPVAFYFAIWILATAMLVAWVRGASSFLIGSRYSIYSILLLVFCYSFLMHYLSGRSSPLNRRRFYLACLVVAAAMCFAADVHAYRKLGERRRMVFAGIELYRADPEANSPLIDPLILKAYPGEDSVEQRALTKAIHERVYKLPPKPDLR